MHIYCDGSGWNGKKCGYCFTTDTGYTEKHFFNENFTNNQMEYRGIIEGMKYASNGSEIITDSMLCYNQILRKWKIKTSHLIYLAIQARDLMKSKQLRISWVSREENLAGHILEKK